MHAICPIKNIVEAVWKKCPNCLTNYCIASLFLSLFHLCFFLLRSHNIVGNRPDLSDAMSPLFSEQNLHESFFQVDKKNQALEKLSMDLVGLSTPLNHLDGFDEKI